MKKVKPKPDHHYFILKNVIFPVMIIMVAFVILESVVGEIVRPFGLAIMLIVGLFYVIYGHLWDSNKVEGRLFWFKD